MYLFNRYKVSRQTFWHWSSGIYEICIDSCVFSVAGFLYHGCYSGCIAVLFIKLFILVVNFSCVL